MARPVAFTSRTLGTPTYLGPVTPPGAGNPVVLAIPADTIWRVGLIHFELTTAAGGAAREVFIGANINGTQAGHTIAGNSQPNGTVRDYAFSPTYPALASAATGKVIGPLPEVFTLALPGDTVTLTIDADNLGAGDAFADIFAWFTEWRQ